MRDWREVRARLLEWAATCVASGNPEMEVLYQEAADAIKAAHLSGLSDAHVYVTRRGLRTDLRNKITAIDMGEVEP